MPFTDSFDMFYDSFDVFCDFLNCLWIMLLQFIVTGLPRVYPNQIACGYGQINTVKLTGDCTLLCTVLKQSNKIKITFPLQTWQPHVIKMSVQATGGRARGREPGRYE